MLERRIQDRQGWASGHNACGYLLYASPGALAMQCMSPSTGHTTGVYRFPFPFFAFPPTAGLSAA